VEAMDNLESYFEQIVRARPESRKGENGKVLVIGGSQLFHAASFWSAAAASKIVDMVHFSSPVIENNELMRVRAKQKFWEGIVVPYSQVAHYIEEDDAILIGPGMERGEETRRIVNDFLAKYRDKRWVVDGGALQEVNPELLNENMICTPNAREREILGGGVNPKVTQLIKGPVDLVIKGSERVEIPGGNPGMTKGGTGDVLAGLVVGFYAKSQAVASCVVASTVNKKASERLAERVGVYYGAGDLISEIQAVMGEFVKT